MTTRHYRWQGLDLVLHCHIQPDAKSTGFCGRHGERLPSPCEITPAQPGQ